MPVAGCMRNDGQSGSPDVWSVYLATDDAKATVDAAAANGGQVIVPAMDVMELGTMAVVTDAGQAAIGIWQPGLHKGFGILGEPGTPTWFELHTRDYDASVQFYRDVFKWDTHVASDTPEFRYTTLGEGDGQLAGIMDASAFLPDGVPAHWSIYFGVDDTDAALAKIVDLGGSIVQPAEDTPYGRLATGRRSHRSALQARRRFLTCALSPRVDHESARRPSPMASIQTSLLMAMPCWVGQTLPGLRSPGVRT